MQAGRAEGKVIMTSQHVFKMLAVIVLVALSATNAQAGAGGVPSTLTSFFLCKSISGPAPGGARVDIESVDSVTPGGAGWGPTLENVKIGVATLACSFARLFPTNPPDGRIACDPRLPENPKCNEISPTPLDNSTQPPSPVQARDLKCYSLSLGRGSGPMPNYTVNDSLLGQGQTVSGSGFNMLCGPAQFNEIVNQ